MVSDVTPGAVPDQNDWTEPGAHEVSPAVHRIPLPLPMDGLRAVNVYVIETDDGLTLIDGGWAIEVSRDLLEESLVSIGHHPRDITSFLVTHAHRDHYTQAATLRTEFGRATIALGEGDRRMLTIIDDPTVGEDPFVVRLREAGAPEVARQWANFVSLSIVDKEMWRLPDTWLQGDVDLPVGERTLRAVPTPGHTPGHYVFADTDAGLLFAGDHVLPTITPSVGFAVGGSGYPLIDFLASLAKVRALPDLTLLPAHGPTGMSSHQRVDELLVHHEHRLALCLASVIAGASTSYLVAHDLPWTRRNRAFNDLDSFNAGMAVIEASVHLDLLAADGRLVRSGVDGVTHYSVPA